MLKVVWGRPVAGGSPTTNSRHLHTLTAAADAEADGLFGLRHHQGKPCFPWMCICLYLLCMYVRYIYQHHPTPTHNPQDKAVADNKGTAAKGAVAKAKTRSYRQYMNRKGKEGRADGRTGGQAGGRCLVFVWCLFGVVCCGVLFCGKRKGGRGSCACRACISFIDWAANWPVCLSVCVLYGNGDGDGCAYACVRAGVPERGSLPAVLSSLTLVR